MENSPRPTPQEPLEEGEISPYLARLARRDGKALGDELEELESD
ncbi:MAG: hypothetical protein ACW99A_15430 [Candidatus Kariarchaeaceae archaeon]|jgi:hypothetical protein